MLLNLPYHRHALQDRTEDDVLTVQVLRLRGGNEELASISVRARVGHGELSCSGMFEHEVLIREFFAIDRLAACAIAVGEIATLDHEIFDDPVELAALVAIALFASA